MDTQSIILITQQDLVKGERDAGYLFWNIKGYIK